MLYLWQKYSIIDLPVTSQAETDLNFRFVIEKKAQMNSDYSDIRFTLDDGITLIPQFREKFDSNESIWWIKTDKPQAGKQIFVYFGNPEASLISDHESVFPLSDTFPGPAIDTGKWNIPGGLA
jgi:hypothetical protein